ncbi:MULTISPECIES: fibronectin type III domain-containing protein [unclassified Microbacterium]|uniref:fibronectin type III domain-containing protein n=1 Tax=unclassified Microbacterium TaxID=2609290 RepID=UPI00301A78CE
MSITLQPSAELVAPGVIDTPARPTEGRASLDATRVPFAQAEVTLPITEDALPLIDKLDPRQPLRGTLTLAEQIANTSRVFDLAVQSRRVTRDGRTMTVSLGGDETLLQQYYPLTEDRAPLDRQDSVRAVCNYVLGKVITLRRNLIPNSSTSGTGGWSAGRAGTSGHVVNLSNAGSDVRATLTTSGGSGGSWWLATNSIAIDSTKPLSMRGRVRGESAAFAFYVEFIFYGETGGSSISTVTSPVFTSSSSGYMWAALEGVTPPPGAVTVVMRLRRVGGASGNHIGGYRWVMEQAPAAGEYFDGNTDRADGIDYAWEGAANASPSRSFPRLKSSPGVDANATAYWTVTNLLTEPGHEGALGWTTGTNATALGPASPARSGSVAARWTAPAAGATWIDTAGPIRVQQGRTYTISTFMRAVAAIPGRFMVRFRNDAGVILQETFSPQTPLTSAYQRLVYSATAPPGATQATLHIGAITTGSNQQVWNDDAMFYEGTEEIPFFDGNTPNDANYTYAWSGVAQQSTSTRTPVVDRPLETFYWRPSMSGWEFLMALVGSFGYRLFCDERRNWFLIDPNTYVLPGEVATGAVATAATDTIDRTDDAYVTGVSILWKWRDRWGIDQERTETAGTAGRVRNLTFDRPYPGTGLAAAILARAAGAGREHDVTAFMDLTATPAMKFSATFPGVATQRARVTAVEWGIRDGLMRVTGRNGNSVPDAPAAPKVTSPVSGRLVVSWSPPADDGGFPILDYTIGVNEGNNSGDDIRGVTSPNTSNGWAPGVKQVYVAARNIYGRGPYSPATLVTVS